jgi:hypothetical protein
MGSKRLGLARTQALIEQLKRELDLSGSTLKNANVTANAQDLSGDGLQSGSISAPTTVIQEFGNEVITTFQIDLQNLSGNIAAGKVIGVHNATTGSDSHAYLLQWDNGKNGICHKIELACIEAPKNGKNSGNPTFQLSSSTYNVYEWDDVPAGDPTFITEFGRTPFSASMTVVKDHLASSPGDEEYIYLCTADANSGATSGSYTQGKLVLKFHSYKDFS